MLQQSKHGLLCPKTGEIPAQGGNDSRGDRVYHGPLTKLVLR